MTSWQLAARAASKGEADRICLSVAGDDPRAKAMVRDLIDTLGFDAIDAGLLADSWRQQPGTPAYCRDLNAEALKGALAQADRSQVASYRQKAEEEAAPYFRQAKS